MVTEATTSTLKENTDVGRLVAYVDCGNLVGDHDPPHQYPSGLLRSVPKHEPVKARTIDLALMGESNQWERHSKQFEYRVDVPYPGEYDVTLVFCENHSHCDSQPRVMNVEVCGTETRSINGLDIYKRVGQSTVLELEEKSVKADLAIRVVLDPVSRSPHISGIIVRESVKSRPADVRPLITYVDVGGVETDTGRGQPHGLSNPHRQTNVDIKGRYLDMGNTCRYTGNVGGYSIPIHTPGKYYVTLVFCETMTSGMKVGARVFSAAVQGTREPVEFKDIDVFKTVGKNAEHELTALVDANFSIRVDLSKGSAGHPFISGIIVRGAEAGNIDPNAPIAVIDCGNETCKEEKDYMFPSNVGRGEQTDFQIYNKGEEYKFFSNTWRSSGRNFQYSIDVPFPGEYDVTLLFRDTPSATTVGARMFDTVIKGNKDSYYHNDIDIIRRVGKGRILEITEKSVSADLAIHINLIQKVGWVMICGIIVKPAGTSCGLNEGPVPPVGGEDVIGLRKAVSLDCGSLIPMEDLGDYVTSEVRTDCSSKPEIKIEGDNAVFASYGRSHRWSLQSFSYNVPVSAPGAYDVTLIFAEIFAFAFTPGKRVFDFAIRAKETFEVKDFDICKEAGPKRVCSITKKVNALSMIYIDLKKGKTENPMISGIVITPSKN